MPGVMRASRAGMIELFPSLLDGSLQRQTRAAQRTIDNALDPRPPRSGIEKAHDAIDDALEAVRFDWRAYLTSLREYDALIPADSAWSPATEKAFDDLEARWRRDGTAWYANPVRMLRLADAAECLARVALAACEHRHTHGAWPDSTAELAPLFADGVPPDPFTSAPFRLTTDGNALVLRASPPESGTEGSLREAGLEWRLAPRK